MINLNFTDKEISIIELMAPPKTAEEVCNLVMRDWYNSNVDRMYKVIKPQTQVEDEIIAVATASKATLVDTPAVVDTPVV